MIANHPELSQNRGTIYFLLGPDQVHKIIPHQPTLSKELKTLQKLPIKKEGLGEKAMKMMSIGQSSTNEKVEKFKAHIDEFTKAILAIQTGLEKLYKQETGE